MAAAGRLPIQLTPRLRAALVWLWVIALIASTFGPFTAPVVGLVGGLFLGSLVGVCWRSFTLRTALLTILAVGALTLVTFLTSHSDLLAPLVTFVILAVLMLISRRLAVPRVTVANAMVNGSLGFCLGYIAALVITSRFPHEGPSFDWEALVWTPLVLVFTAGPALVLFSLGCIAIPGPEGKEGRDDASRK